MLQASSELSIPAGSGMSFGTDPTPTDRRARHMWPLAEWLSPSCWQGRLFWLVVLIGPVWLLDGPLARANLHDKKFLLLGDIRDVTRQFGEPMGIAWIVLVLWFVDWSRRRPLVVAIVATLIASGLGSGTKLLVGRERPKVSEGRTIVTGPHWPGAMTPDPSFPSGHTAVAFAFAFGLGQIHPQHRRLWLFLAAGCGLSRAIGEAHYLTDVVAGGWLGFETARVFWSSRIGGWLMSRLDRRIPHTGWFPRWDWKLAGQSPVMSAAVAEGGT